MMRSRYQFDEILWVCAWRLHPKAGAAGAGGAVVPSEPVEEIRLAVYTHALPTVRTSSHFYLFVYLELLLRCLRFFTLLDIVYFSGGCRLSFCGGQLPGSKGWIAS